MSRRTCSMGVMLLFALASWGMAQTPWNRSSRVTPVSGESWLVHLGRSFDETSMGKTGRLGPTERGAKEKGSGGAPSVPLATNEKTAVLRGGDLYRLNCRGCHGEEGQGAPPEINSVINPVRAGSAALVFARMKHSGMNISHAEAAELARQSQVSLLRRIHKGGQDMPPFLHLDEREIRALTDYLKDLADVPGAQPQRLQVTEPLVRVGEHIVKSTCHICHSASGENPNAEQLSKGAIPPLSTLTSRVNQEQFVRKVTQGAPIAMGIPPMPFRGRMPVFYYLSEEEAASAYLYLTSYPPYQWATLDPAPAFVPDNPPSSESRPSQSITEKEFTSGGVRRDLAPRGDSSDGLNLQLIMLMGAPVTLFLTGGLVFTLRECKRLAAKGIHRQPVPLAPHIAKSAGRARDARLSA